MKNLKDLLIVVAVGATLAFPVDSDAALFGRARARRVARRSTAEVCVGPQCLQPVDTGGPSQLRINPKGGFEGQLTDSYYADYFSKKTGTTAKDVPAKMVQADAEASAVAAAEAKVEAAEAVLAEAKASSERATLEQKRSHERMRLELQNQIDDLTARLEALRPETD